MRRLIRDMPGRAKAQKVFQCRDGEHDSCCLPAVPPGLDPAHIQIPGIDGIGATRQITAADPQAKVMTSSQTTMIPSFEPLHNRPVRAATSQKRTLW